MTTYTTDNMYMESTSTESIESTTTLNLTLVTDDPGKGTLILNESITDLNVTTAEYIPIVTAATAFASLIAIGIISISIFIIVLIRGRKRFQEFPFFAIVYHLTAVNAIHILMQCTTVLPIMLMESDEDSANRFWYKVGSYVISVTEQASLYFTLLMTVNRFAVFVCPSMLAVFTSTGIHIISSIFWFYINFIVFWNYNYGTVKTFSRKTLSAQEVLLGSNFLTKFFTLSFTFLPIIMLSMYFVIFIFIMKKRGIVENRKRTDRDTSLVIQALIITVALECVNITEILTPLFQNSEKSVQWVWTIFSYCVTIINQLVNPIFFLTSNKMVRSVARHIFDKNISTFLSDNSSSARAASEGRKILSRRRAFCFFFGRLFRDERKKESVVATF